MFFQVFTIDPLVMSYQVVCSVIASIDFLRRDSPYRYFDLTKVSITGEVCDRGMSIFHHRMVVSVMTPVPVFPALLNQSFLD